MLIRFGTAARNLSTDPLLVVVVFVGTATQWGCGIPNSKQLTQYIVDIRFPIMAYYHLLWPVEKEWKS